MFSDVLSIISRLSKGCSAFFFGYGVFPSLFGAFPSLSLHPLLLPSSPYFLSSSSVFTPIIFLIIQHSPPPPLAHHFPSLPTSLPHLPAGPALLQLVVCHVLLPATKVLPSTQPIDPADFTGRLTLGLRAAAGGKHDSWRHSLSP